MCRHLHVCACVCRYVHIVQVFDQCYWPCIKSGGISWWGLCALKKTLKKTKQLQQNVFDASGAQTPVFRCTDSDDTMYHWAIQADKIQEMMEYIQHYFTD